MKSIFLNIILTIIILFCFNTGNSAIRRIEPISIAELVNNSKFIYLGKFVKSEHGFFYFEVKDINSIKGYSKTIKLPDNSADFDTIQNRLQRRISFDNKIVEVLSERNKELIKIQNADELIIFIFENYEIPMYFINKKGGIYRQGYNHHNNKSFFYRVNKEKSWKEQILIILKVIKRIDEIHEIHEIKDDNIRNKELFNWIDKNKETFNQFCGYKNSNNDCGWANLDSHAFRWITEAGIEKDTWKASKLYNKIMSFNDKDYCILFDYGKNSFNSYKSINFLLKTAINQIKSKDERIQALVFLWSSCREFSYSRDSTSFKLNQKRKIKIIKQLLPLLLEKKLKYLAFEIISTLNEEIDLKQNHKEIFNHLCDLYEYEPPSRFKDELIDFIYCETTEKEWKNITGNPHKILVSVEHFAFDTELKKIYLNLENNDKSITIRFTPKIVFEKIDKNFKILETQEFKLKEFLVPFKKNKSRRIEIKVSTLSSGIWKIYLLGYLENSSDFWKSEYSILKI